MSNDSSVKRFVHKALKEPVLFRAVNDVVSSRYHPRVACDADFRQLPELLQLVNDVIAFIINSTASGLIGLFDDGSINTHIDKIDHALEEIGAQKALKFLRSVKSALPQKR